MFGKHRVYLDQAAGVSGNAGSPHEEGRVAKARLEAAREQIARLIEVKADDVVFTSGATEANALAILGYVRAARKQRRNNAHVLYLPSSHASVAENMRLLQEEGVVVEPLPIVNGRVDTDMLATMLTPNTILVSMDAVCGETGVIWNTREVAETIQRGPKSFSRSLGAGQPLDSKMTSAHAGAAVSVRLHVDASQAPLTEKVTRSHFGSDILTFDISKISPLRGLGVLVAHRTIPLEPLYRGGGQERGLRPGSESPYMAEAFATVLAEAVEGRDAFVAEAARQRAELIVQLGLRVPEALINEATAQAPNIINLSLPGRDTDYLVALLDEAGFAVSTRSACETDSDTGSRAVLALTGDPLRAKSTLRVSWGPGVRSRDLVRLAEALERALKLA